MFQFYLLLVLVTGHMQQTKSASSLVNFWVHVNLSASIRLCHSVDRKRHLKAHLFRMR